MAYKLFLDANIILDYAMNRPVGYKPAKQIFESIVAKEHSGYTSPIAIHIITYIYKKDFGATAARGLILSLLNDITVLNTSHEIVIQAMSAGWSDIEDSLQYYTALANKMDVFLSRDEDLAKRALPTLPVYTAESFTRLIGRY